MGEIRVGDRFPTFALPDQNGETFRSSEALSKGPLVVFFYPKDESPGCTAEVCSFRDASSEFLAAGAQVVGISSDDATSHQRFAKKHAVSYPLLSDTGGSLRSELGVPRSMFGMIDGRVTYVIDSQGIVRHRYDALLRATRHVDEALATVKSLKPSS